MADNVKRMIKEDGIVLEKIFKEASDTKKLSDGRVIEAQPDRYILKCVSGYEFSKDTGFSNSTVLDYKADKQVYDKVVAYSPIVVKYELSNFGAKAVSVELKENK
jgi:hypothetical protein